MPKDLTKFKVGEFCLDPKKDRIGVILVNSSENLSIRWLPEELDQNIVLGHLKSKEILRLGRLRKLNLAQYNITLCGLPTAICKIETFGDEAFTVTRLYLKSLCFEKLENPITENSIINSIPDTILDRKFQSMEIQSKQKASIIKTVVNFYFE